MYLLESLKGCVINKTIVPLLIAFYWCWPLTGFWFINYHFDIRWESVICYFKNWKKLCDAFFTVRKLVKNWKEKSLRSILSQKQSNKIPYKIPYKRPYKRPYKSTWTSLTAFGNSYQVGFQIIVFVAIYSLSVFELLWPSIC